VVDFKLFTPGQPLPDNLLWIGEQLPGQFPRADVTAVRARCDVLLWLSHPRFLGVAY
jgi:hypothetical protein